MADTPMFRTVDDMIPKIEDYFIDCDRRGKRYTVPGLAYFLGFADRQSLLDYQKKPEFSCTIKRAKTRIEVQRVEDLIDPETKNSNGIKFDLTNNFGYHEKQEVEHSGLPTPPSTLTVVIDKVGDNATG